MAATFAEAVYLNDYSALCSLFSNLSPEDAKMKINEADAFGDTALHLACQKKQVLIVRFLVLHGADPNIKNNVHISASNHLLKLLGGFYSTA